MLREVLLSQMEPKRSLASSHPNEKFKLPSHQKSNKLRQLYQKGFIRPHLQLHHFIKIALLGGCLKETLQVHVVGQVNFEYHENASLENLEEGLTTTKGQRPAPFKRRAKSSKRLVYYDLPAFLLKV